MMQGLDFLLMNAGQGGGSGPVSPNFTVGVIGDSNADGAASVITTCASNTLFNWTGAAFTEITTQSVSNDVPTGGSIWQPYATAYKAITGNPVYLVNGGKGGSSVFTSTFSWYTTGTLYATFKSKMAAALTSLNKSLPDLIIINVCVNDIRAGFSLANITLGINSLVSRITADYPGVNVLVLQVGRTETDVTSGLIYDVRELWVDTCNANANFHMCGSPPALVFLSGYEADGLHYNQVGQGLLGSNLARWSANSAYSKWGRSLISTFFDDLSSARKTLVDNFIQSQITSGNYFRLDELNVFKTTISQNLQIDWSFIGYGAQRTSSFVANDSISTNGTSTYYDMGYVSTYYTRRSSQNNVMMGVKLKTRTTTATAYLMGSFDAADGSGILQLASPTPIAGRINESATFAGTDILLQAGNLYSVGRSGTTRNIYKNKVSQGNASAASLGLCIQPISIGAINNNGTRSTFLAGSYEYAFVAENDAFNFSNFYDNIEILIANW